MIETRMSQQATTALDNPKFHAFLEERFALTSAEAGLENCHVECVFVQCGITSLVGLDRSSEAAEQWRELHSEFQADDMGTQ